MFKIISGDFAKDTSIQSDKLVEMRGFNFIKTSIGNAKEINLIPENEIKAMIYNADYSVYTKDLEKALKSTKVVCFEYKYTNGKTFKALADLNTYHKIQKLGEKEIDEEKLVTIRDTKPIAIIFLVLILIYLFLPNNNSSNIITKEQYGDSYPYMIDNLELKCNGYAVWVVDSNGYKYALNGQAYSELQQNGDTKLKGYTNLISKNAPAVNDNNILEKGLSICGVK